MVLEPNGGQMLPPYLQGRTLTPNGPFKTGPMITPKPTAYPGVDSGFKPNVGYQAPKPLVPPAGPAITPNAGNNFGIGGFPRQPNLPGLNITPATPQPGIPAASANANANDTQTLFEFLKKDLENERNSALSNARSSAAGRGVYYGTPLTTSEGDINTSFLRGLGQLQSGIIQNEQQNQLQRLGLASNLIGSPASFGELAQQGQGNPDVYNAIGSLFAGQTPAPAGPQITPNAAPGQAVQKPTAQPIQQPFAPQLPYRPGQQTPTPIKPFNPYINRAF